MASSFLFSPPPITPLALSIASSRCQTRGAPLSSPSLSSVPPLAVSPSSIAVYCGRGDKKTAKGKRFNHSFGNARPRDKNKGRGPPRIPVPSSPSAQPPLKDKFEDDEVVKIDIDDSLL
ncbi:hypothetical protein MLD38_028661 [Melastoma candidum]|uniref:Uncharacterized protein n=1 Tax=Melastoma candidum TaxID=119954 RepID=A0ACB9N290_9MYRT|nr:hypothetical protein MLD38_028661 [Melastoma candidum]